MPRILTIIFILLLNQTVFSQINMQNTVDAKAFLHEYLTPLGESLGATLNNGWYNTARPHRFGGFDATITLNVLNIPASKENFNPNSIENFSSTEQLSPTIIGKGNGATIEYEGEQFTMPTQKSGMSFLPIPTLNFGVGIFKKTEINGRYVPNYKYNGGFIGKGEISMWGLGFKHDILQWIPIIGDAIPLSLSLQGGYTQLNTKINIIDQAVNIDVRAMNINLIVSRNILILTGYASVGYNSATTTFSAGENLSNLDSFNIGDLNFDLPVSMTFESKNEIRANLGLRFTLAVLALQANYTFSEYPVTTIGVGVSLR
jgi:hypothetical protein